MSKLNWRKAHLDGKRSTSIADESDFRDRDAAARWLERNAKKAKGKRHGKRRPAPAPERAA